MTADDQRLAVGDGEHEVVAGPEAANPLGIVLAVPQRVVQVFVDVQHRLGHRHVDPLTLAGALALEQRGHDRRRRLDGGVHVGVAVRVLGVVAGAGVALRGDDPGLGLDDRCVCPTVRPRPGLRRTPRSTRTRAAGSGRAPSSASRPRRCHHAGSVVLHEDVGVLGEVEEERRARRRSRGRCSGCACRRSAARSSSPSHCGAAWRTG